MLDLSVQIIIADFINIFAGVGGNPECVRSETNPNQTIPAYPEPRFSVSSFFIILLVMMVCSWLAYIGLNILNICKAERLDQDTNLLAISARSYELNSVSSKGSNVWPRDQKTQFSKLKLYLLLVTQAYLSCLANGIIPSNYIEF